jgi:hypothetical protein
LRRITALGYFPDLLSNNPSGIPWLDEYPPPGRARRAQGGLVQSRKGIPIQNALASLASRRGQTPQGFLGGIDSRGIGGLG